MRWVIAIIVFLAAEAALIAEAQTFECGGKAPVQVEAPVAAPLSLAAAMIAAAIAKRWTASAQASDRGTRVARIIAYWLVVALLLPVGAILYLFPHICG